MSSANKAVLLMAIIIKKAMYPVTLSHVVLDFDCLQW